VSVAISATINLIVCLGDLLENKLCVCVCMCVCIVCVCVCAVYVLCVCVCYPDRKTPVFWIMSSSRQSLFK